MVSPAAAQIETTNGVVLFPAIPPIQCLSAIIFLLKFILFPVLIIDFVRAINSFLSIPWNCSAETKKAISASVRLLCEISEIRVCISSSESLSPINFFFIIRPPENKSAGKTST